MRIPDKLIRVSRESIYSKRFDVTEEQLIANLDGKELEEAIAFIPTDEEREFMEIFNSRIPQLARLQRKMSVCLDAEVTELSEEYVSYEYAGKTFRISAPKNAYRICTALDKGISDGFAEMCSQGVVEVSGKAILDVKRDSSLGVDELKLMMKISSKFFFQTYLE